MLEQADSAAVGTITERPRSIAAGRVVSRGDRVLFLLSTLSIGGSERKVVKLSNALVQEGRHVTVAYLNGPDPLKEQFDSKVELINLERSGKFSVASLRRLAAIVEGEHIDTVVAVNLYAMLYAALLKRITRRARHVRFLASLNTTDFNTRKAKIQLVLYRPLLRMMDRLIFGAEYQRGLWRSQHLRRRAPASSVLYNGVDTEHFSRTQVEPFLIPGWPTQRIVIGTVGVLRPEKSHDLLLKAAAAMVQRGHDVGVLLVGDGPQEPTLRRLAVELKLHERICFSGSARDVRPYLAAMDVFVLTSTAVETFSNAALEALAMECPVVCSAIGGMPEMLRDGGGMTYRIGDLDELIAQLERVVVSSSSRSLLAQQGRASVLRRFSLHTMVSEFRALIQSDPRS